MARIFIVDDEHNIRAALKSALDKRGHDTVTAADCSEARRFLSAGFDLIFLDVMLPDGNGLDLLKEIMTHNRRQTVVMISGQADIDTAVKAIRMGAWDFVEKPLSLDRILILVDNAVEKHRLSAENEQLRSLVYGNLTGQSEVIQKLREDIMRAAPRTTRFLLTGENGTGKELAAHLIHRHSRYANGPFVAVNCAALPAELVEAELFGHTSGAFTGAKGKRRGRFIEANNGSIFLDEIGEMPSAAQAKILRVLETNEIIPVGADTPVTFTGNIIAATNRDLPELIAQGRFREDLYFRLNVVSFHLPPLRERRDDIPRLAEYLLTRLAEAAVEPPRQLSRDACAFLQQLTFRGNVRELRNLMERVTIYCEGPVVTADAIKALIPSASMTTPQSLKRAVENFEREYIEAALARHKGNMTETARELGIERSHLYKKLRKYESHTADNEEAPPGSGE